MEVQTYLTIPSYLKIYLVYFSSLVLVMSLGWSHYGTVYYVVQSLSFFVFYFLLVVLLPYHLIDWAGEALFGFENKVDVQDKGANFPEVLEENKVTNIPEVPNRNKATYIPKVLKKNKKSGDPDEHKECTAIWDSLCFLARMCKPPKKKSLTHYKVKNYGWCICDQIWTAFGNFLQCKKIYCSLCKPSTKPNEHVCKCCSDEAQYCATNFYHCCFECDCQDADLHEKDLPLKRDLNLSREHERWYLGCMHCNLNRLGVYFILSAALWLGFLVFFEQAVLSYGVVRTGASCPMPNLGTESTTMDCFIFNSGSWPINPDSPIQCNKSTTVSFTGDFAVCCAYIYQDVKAFDYMDKIGVCTGVVAFIGTLVVILSHLLHHHRWRLFFEVVAAGCVVAAPTIGGGYPFASYIMLVVVAIIILVTEYLVGKPVGLTWCCLCYGLLKCFKNKDSKPDGNEVSVWTKPANTDP